MTPSDIQLVAVFLIIAAAIIYIIFRVMRRRSGNCPDGLANDDCGDCPLKKNCKKVGQKFVSSKNMPTFATQNQKRRLRK